MYKVAARTRNLKEKKNASESKNLHTTTTDATKKEQVLLLLLELHKYLANSELKNN